MPTSPARILLFATIVCAICAVAVSSVAVLLQPRIAENRQLDREKKVLIAAGLILSDDQPSGKTVRDMFRTRVTTQQIEFETGTVSTPLDGDGNVAPVTRAAPANAAGLVEIPVQSLFYTVTPPDQQPVVVFPVEGKGLWSTMRGFLALDARTLNTVIGLEFYEHAETPGLGGEIDNPRWKALWKDRLAFDAEGRAMLHVAKRRVGPASEYPHGVDAIAGATITGRGVTELLKFWLGPDGYGPLLARLRQEGGS